MSGPQLGFAPAKNWVGRGPASMHNLQGKEERLSFSPRLQVFSGGPSRDDRVSGQTSPSPGVRVAAVPVLEVQQRPVPKDNDNDKDKDNDNDNDNM